MPIQRDHIVEGPFWPEQVKVVNVTPIDESQFKIEAVGIRSRTFYNPILSKTDLSSVKIIEHGPCQFSGDGEVLFLYLESHRIRNAFLFDPLCAVNVSQIDPLPHQIDAVYHTIMPNTDIRFMLADDPGAGKTIMAGLLLKELKYRGLVERTLIVVPGHLKDQWLREMKEKFKENFSVIDRNVMHTEWGKNVFTDRNQLIISLDFAKQDDVMLALKDSHWDLCIVDEAHKMSAYKYGEKISKTQRYAFGELISSLSKYLLFLSATPHRGDPENFRLLLDLLKPDFFANASMLAESIQKKDNPLFLRRLKEDLKDFEKAPLFPPRQVKTTRFNLSDDEKKLYNAVTEYVQKHFNKALEKEKRNVTFALTILQRRLASSVRAIRKSLERRHDRLNELYKKGQLMQEIQYDEDYIEDLEEKERWKKEEELLEKLTSSETLEELHEEIQKLKDLVDIARRVEQKEIETKLSQLKQLMEEEKLHQTKTKLLIFTESRDTLEYLVEKLRKWDYSVAFIHGGMDLNERIKVEADFKNNKQIMISTEAGGEGINLQFCWIMVNYDIPWNPNRLEQRMGRIHRYGQQHEVHIYNLVAVDTKEGQILNRLFDKLSQIRDNLGSDRVFDVIGEVLPGKSLKDLIIAAIANRRTMEDILQDFERVPDEEAIRKVREASFEALATRHIDFKRILGEQRKARENRLVPEYIEEFFKRAARMLNIHFQKGENGLWRITEVPFEIRNQSHEFNIKYGEVQKEYVRVSFDKQIAFKKQAEFIATGHPLLEAMVNTLQTHYAHRAAEGATFSDPAGKWNGILWFLEAEIKDGNNAVAGKKLLAVYQDCNNRLSLINPTILWDLKPLPEKKEFTHSNMLNLTQDKSLIISYVIKNGLEDFKNEILANRKRDAGIKRKYGINSLELFIIISEGKITDYEIRRINGESIPEATIQNEKRKKDDLIKKKQKLEKEIIAETNLYPTEPKLIGAIRVVPDPLNNEKVSHLISRADSEIEQIGMQEALNYERSQGRIPEDVSAQNLGYDIQSCTLSSTTEEAGEITHYRYIEVKARAHEGPIALTPNEWLMAQRLQQEYWLYVVTHAAENPKLYIIQNPAASFKPDEEIDIVRYVIKNWKEKAEPVQ